MADRVGYASRLLYTPETAYGADPGSPVSHIVPLAEATGYSDSSDPVTAPIYMGDGLLPYDVVSGLIMAGGTIPMDLEYEFIGYPLKSFFGTDGYAHVASTKQHDFFIATTTGATSGPSFQLQKEWLEGTDVYLRGKGNKISSLAWEGASSGYARWAMDVIGNGDMVQTDIAGTKTDNGFAASSYTDGQLRYKSSDGTWFTLTDVAGLRCRLFNGASRREAFYNGGKAAMVNTFKINGEGELSLPMLVAGTGPTADLNFYNDAVDADEVFIDTVQANAPLSSGNATKFIRYRFQALRLIRQSPRVGGDGEITYQQRFILRRSDNAKVAGEYIFPTAGTYNIGATTNKIGIKVDGGATIEATLTQGAARTATQVAAEIDAAVAGITADVYLGRYVRIYSDTTGSTSSVQIDTAVVNSGHALFGLDGTARAGRSNCPLIITNFCAKTTDF